MTKKELIDKIANREKVVLYHGSKGGIDGDILPISRPRCDFGKGFYMGTNPEQAKGMVAYDASPVFYTVEFDFSKIPPGRILVLDGLDWLYTILSFRKKSEEFSSLSISKNFIRNTMDYDVIVGAIADDRMNDAIQEFSNYSLTDAGLSACLTSIDYGWQIVARTKRACDAITIVSSRDIFGKEADDMRRYTEQKRKESRNIVTEMKKKHQRDGVYLNEIIEKEKANEIRANDRVFGKNDKEEKLLDNKEDNNQEKSAPKLGEE